MQKTRPASYLQGFYWQFRLAFVELISLTFSKANLSYPAFIMKMPSFADPRIEQLFFNLSVVRKVYMVTPLCASFDCHYNYYNDYTLIFQV